jgi:hypothetical protein
MTCFAFVYSAGDEHAGDGTSGHDDGAAVDDAELLAGAYYDDTVGYQ